MRNQPVVVGAQTWRKLYRAALFETDRQALPLRIAEAEKALVLRARELFDTSGNSDEAEAIDDALYALQALRSCMRLRTNEPDAA